MKKNILTVIICIFLNINIAHSRVYYDSFAPAMPSARLGVGSIPEKTKDTKAISTKKETTKVISAKTNNQAVTYADLDLKQISRDITDELDIDSAKMLSDLSILYNSAVQRSETIKYAIYKLSNPDSKKPDENIIKRILKPIASFSTIAGTALSGNPYMASGAIIGGGLMNAFSTDDKDANYRFTKVNDADMVLLVKRIDELQKKLLNVYTNYVTQKKLLKMSMDNLENRRKIYNSMQNATREELIIADNYYRNAQDFAKKTRREYELTRTILENLAGKDALAEIEKDD